MRREEETPMSIGVGRAPRRGADAAGRDRTDAARAAAARRSRPAWRCSRRSSGTGRRERPGAGAPRASFRIAPSKVDTSPRWASRADRHVTRLLHPLTLSRLAPVRRVPAGAGARGSTPRLPPESGRVPARASGRRVPTRSAPRRRHQSSRGIPGAAAGVRPSSSSSHRLRVPARGDAPAGSHAGGHG